MAGRFYLNVVGYKVLILVHVDVIGDLFYLNVVGYKVRRPRRIRKRC